MASWNHAFPHHLYFTKEQTSVSIAPALTQCFRRIILKLMTKELKLLTIPEVAKRLTISRRTAYRLIERKELKAIKISTGIYRVEEKDLIQFLKKHKTK